MNAMIAFRVSLPLIGAGIFILAVKLIKPPKAILYLVLKLCWFAGLSNLIWDVVATGYGLWRFTMDPVLFGLPLDMYFTVSLVWGGGLLLFYWWLRSSHPAWTTPFVVLIPFYGLLRDYLGQKATGSAFLVWESPYWWIPDFLAYGTTLWTLFFIFHKLTRSPRPDGKQ